MKAWRSVTLLITVFLAGCSTANESYNNSVKNSQSEMGICQSDDATFSGLREQVLCLIDNKMYSYVDDVIETNDLNDSELFKALSSYSSLYTMTGSVEEFREKWTRVGDQLRTSYYDKNVLTDEQYNSIRDEMETLLFTKTEQLVKSESKEKGFFDPEIGMTAEELLQSKSWGKPKDINRTTTASGVSEQWVYSGNRYVYLEDGIVTSIQE